MYLRGEESDYQNWLDRMEDDLCGLAHATPEQKARWAEEDRLIREDSERKAEAAAADLLVELQRMRNARIRKDRNPAMAHVELGDYYKAYSRVIGLLDDFRIERWPVPDFVMQQWDAERRA